jgi:hypothetical protein
MEKELINRILVSKHFFYLAQKTIKSKAELNRYSTINLLQDSVEIFLLALAYHLDANITSKTSFDNYILEIDKKVIPYELPFKAQLIRLNKIRVNSKHYCILPQEADCQEFIQILKYFFSEVSSKILNTDYDTISLIYAIEDSESKGFLIEAESLLHKGNFVECAIECRKALYIEFEKEYDISNFIEEANEFLKAVSKAPYFTKNKDYIEKNVLEPTDYIVLDHGNLERQLLKYSIDDNLFWNIWRLTPELYRYPNGDWAIKEEFNILDEDNIAENINYIFNSSIDIVLKIQEYKRNVIHKGRKHYYIELLGSNIPVYKKADKESEVVLVIPEDMKEVDSNYSVTGLNDREKYYHIITQVNEIFYTGFISASNVK